MTPAEIAQVERLVAEVQDVVLADADATDSADFLPMASVYAQEMPRRLRETLTDIRALETAAACVVSGFPVDDAVIGPTPRRWKEQAEPRSTLREELWLVLCGSLLGDLFGWATQQDGAVMHDISPTPGNEKTQLGSGSDALLWWHTEEAFHPHKCDYLGLLSLRNLDEVATTFATIAGVAAELDPAVVEVLSQPRYQIRPDDSHLETDRLPASTAAGREAQLMIEARDRVERMNRDPQPVSVFSGDPADPYLAIDPYYMTVPDEDVAAREALQEVSRFLDARLQPVVLRPGDTLFLDNLRAVHGRVPFTARYDGRDRWLKRINITRDLRRSRASRLTCGSRIIY